jgi:hypothetical protein
LRRGRLTSPRARSRASSARVDFPGSTLIEITLAAQCIRDAYAGPPLRTP